MDKTRREGLLYHLGKWFYGEYILEEGDGASGPVLPVTGEYCLWYVDEMIDFIVHHGVEEDEDLVEECQSYVDKISKWYEDDERKYFDFVESKWGKRKLMSRASNLRDKFEDLLRSLESDYAENYAERVFHDRELCAYISRLIITIGHAPEDVESGEVMQWIEREHIPKWAQRAVVARDRGRCAECGTDITNELRETPHVDHIIPLSQGGTNDLVNLQLLCSECNLSKGSRDEGVARSMPAYLQQSQ